MKKILIANDRLKGGGVENVLHNLVWFLLKQGNEITLMIPGCSETEIHDLFDKNVKTFPTMRSLKKVKRFSFFWLLDRGLFVIQHLLYRIRFFLKQYDAVIALKEGPIMIELAVLYGKRKFAWIHTDYSVMHWTKSGFKSPEHERRCMMKYEKVICVSEAAMKAVIQTVGDPGNLCVKYNPINYARIRAQALELCMEQRTTDGLLFISIGRLAYPKNYSLLIEACHELKKKYSFEVWIVGDGPDRAKLQEKIDTYDLDCVKLVGGKENPFPYLKQADVFISVSLVESYGLAIQEALILGKPVIAVKCPAIEETLDEDFGLLIEGTVADVKNAMEAILIDKEKLTGYRSAIENEYEVDELFEKRMRDICDLWSD